jgi:thiamine biosynthesis lipoprotein
VTIDLEHRAIGTLPGTVLDLGATAKAWAADRACAAIADELGCGTLVSLGGDLAVRSAPEGGFGVGIADVCGDASTSVEVSVGSGGLATSGIGRRHWTLGRHEVHHLIDPETGLPVDSYWRTVSVAAGSCVDANTASTAAMVKGVGAITWLEERGLPARLVRTDGLCLTAAGWPADEADEERGHNRPGPPDR